MPPLTLRLFCASPRIYIRTSRRQATRLATYRASSAHTPQSQRILRVPSRHTGLTHASYSAYALVFATACGVAIAYEYFASISHLEQPTTTSESVVDHTSVPGKHCMPDYASMPTPDGYLGNLTPQQETKLREFWALLLKSFDVPNPSNPDFTVGALSPTSALATTEPETPTKKKRRSLFSRGKDDDGTSSPTSGSAGEEDKYGQTAELQRILKTMSPEALQDTAWEMMKADHPDALLLRFLRARKWDVNRAMAMLISTINWRREQMRVDEDILQRGEEQALIDTNSSDPAVKKEASDYLNQLRKGKTFIHGADRDGRPITYVRVKLHRGGEQSESSMERLTVATIETARLTLESPVETGCIIFDLTSFTLANMDYHPVKFMIKVFEANYPECLGAVLVHKAPWLFQGIWKVIKGWLDPVVAAKVHFTNNVRDLEEYIPKAHIIKELDGENDWEYKYVEVVPGENEVMKDTATRDKIRAERRSYADEYQNLTLKWIATDKKEEADGLTQQRNAIASKLAQSYWRLDPYVRARTLYDRVGLLQKGGKVDYYPQHTLKAGNLKTNDLKADRSKAQSLAVPTTNGISPDDDGQSVYESAVEELD